MALLPPELLAGNAVGSLRASPARQASATAFAKSPVLKKRSGLAKTDPSLPEASAEHFLFQHSVLSSAPNVPGGEDEVMLAVVPVPESGLTPQAIAGHAGRVLARFAQPRFIELVSGLTGKVQRAQLRRRGIGPAIWDNEAR